MVTSLFRVAILMAWFLYAGSVFAADGTCPSGANYLNSTGQPVTLVSLGVANCYYLAADGSDSNDGLSEASGHPWAHLPGMSTCTSNCAALTPTAGMGFIFRGGDTWTGANFGINWQWGGTSGNPIYIGVDPTWYSGSAWARPIWTCGGVACAGATASYFWNASGAYVILDNFELTGLFESPTVSPAFFCASGLNQIYENLYMHGWSHFPRITTTAARGFGCVNNSGWTLRYTVWDGSDTSKDMLVVTQSGAPVAYGNVLRYVQTALDGCGNEWHDNLVEYLAPSVSSGGAHQDAYQHLGPCAGSTYLIYNNIFRHTTWAGATGVGHFWFNGLANCGAIGSPLTNCIGYAFNNVMYDVAPGNQVNMGGHFGVNYGTIYFFNNTIQCGSDSSLGDCDLGDNGNSQGGKASGGTMAVNVINNHWIAEDHTSVFCCSGPAGKGSRGSCYSFTCRETTALYQTVKTAKKKGYNHTGTYAFQPAGSSGSTVGTGASLNSLCAAVSAIDADAGAACNKDTSYACTYNATNHTVNCPARTAVSRPTAVWDVGAYQFSSTKDSRE
jgi:hypothetical protein